MQEIVIAQKEGYRQVLENTKEIHNTITNLNKPAESGVLFPAFYGSTERTGRSKSRAGFAPFLPLIKLYYCYKLYGDYLKSF